MQNISCLTTLRKALHRSLLDGPLTINDRGVPSVADGSSDTSIEFASGMVDRIGVATLSDRLIAQTSGLKFERLIEEYLRASFRELVHIRPGEWIIERGGSIMRFEQYAHLAELDRTIEKNPIAVASLGRGYVIKPDILVYRKRLADSEINDNRNLVDDTSAQMTSLRRTNGSTDLLHACISCKWTMRSDRAQNARSEGLTLVKNRAGNLPHISVVTAEPMPGRLASLAYGTGEIDKVYHIALAELCESIRASQRDDSIEMMNGMIEGNRIRDISDLPLDLAV